MLWVSRTFFGDLGTYLIGGWLGRSWPVRALVGGGYLTCCAAARVTACGSSARAIEGSSGLGAPMCTVSWSLSGVSLASAPRLLLLLLNLRLPGWHLYSSCVYTSKWDSDTIYTVPVFLGHSGDSVLTLGSSQHPVTSFSWMVLVFPTSLSSWRYSDRGKK